MSVLLHLHHGWWNDKEVHGKVCISKFPSLVFRKTEKKCLEAFEQVNVAKNPTINKSGHPPMQRVEMGNIFDFRE